MFWDVPKSFTKTPKHRPRGPLVVVTWQITPVLTRQITLVTSGWRLGFASTYPSGAHYCRSAAFQQLWCEKDSDVDKVWTFSACPKHELKDWYWMVGYDIWYLKRWLHERYLFMDGSNPTVQGLWPKEIFDMPSTHEPPKKKSRLNQMQATFTQMRWYLTLLLALISNNLSQAKIWISKMFKGSMANNWFWVTIYTP